MRDHRTDEQGKPIGDLIRMMEFDTLRNEGGVRRPLDAQERKKRGRKRKAQRIARKINRHG